MSGMTLGLGSGKSAAADEEGPSDDDSGMVSAAKAVLAAIESKDAEALAEALETCCSLAMPMGD